MSLTTDFLLVFLLSVYTQGQDINLANNTTILLLLLGFLGMSTEANDYNHYSHRRPFFC